MAASADAERRAASWSALVAGIGTLLLAFLYLAVVGKTAPEDEVEVAVITGTFFAAAGALLTSAATSRPMLNVLLGGAATGALAVWGVLGLMSIGILLLGAAAVAAFALAEAGERAGSRGGPLAIGSAFAGAAFAAATVALGW